MNINENRLKAITKFLDTTESIQNESDAFADETMDKTEKQKKKKREKKF